MTRLVQHDFQLKTTIWCRQMTYKISLKILFGKFQKKKNQNIGCNINKQLIENRN